MKRMLCLTAGTLIIVITYFLSQISKDLAHISKTDGPSDYLTAIFYIIAVIFIVYGWINRNRNDAD
ncbi:hypothetical protein [Paenibacillus sp. SN-8-1]|uniref:hypothetical protein n=1 Tax=Paenibacillus sp. SN-8-1 TaxID=3435409 RepID=UPI003D9A110E